MTLLVQSGKCGKRKSIKKWKDTLGLIIDGLKCQNKEVGFLPAKKKKV